MDTCLDKKTEAEQKEKGKYEGSVRNSMGAYIYERYVDRD